MLMKLRIRSLAVVALIMGGLAAGSFAADPKDKPTTNAPAMARLLTAYSLIDYGRETKSPLALISAAQVLHNTPTKPLKDLDPKFAESLGKEVAADTAQGLLDEAKGMTDDPKVGDLIAALSKEFKEKPKNVVGGCFSGQFFMDPGEKSLYPPVFRGGEWAEVNARVIGPGTLELTVSDPKQGLNGSDVGNVCRLRWFQKDEGRVNIIRKNLTNGPIRVYIFAP
jgi:hypothetical protein